MKIKDFVEFAEKHGISDVADIALIFDGEEYDYELETTWDVDDEMQQVTHKGMIILKVHC